LSTLHDALGAFLASGRSELVVTDEAGTAVGRLARDRLFELQGARA
jgi:hypothetical protein